MMARVLGGAVGLLLALGCAARPRGDAAAAATSITLERGACRGFCPVYVLSVRGDGRVHFTGVRAVRHLGEDSAQVAPAQVAALLARVEAGGFRQLPDSITLDAPGCGPYTADLPSATLVLVSPSGSHRVLWDPGCRDYPQVLDTLAALVDSVAGSARWTRLPER